MKRLILGILSALMCLFFTACGSRETTAQIAATTLPVYDLTQQLCSGTELRVTRIISQEISCLHDYTLQVSQMRAIEGAQVLVISGAGLEEGLFPQNANCEIIDASTDIPLICDAHTHTHKHEHEHEHEHSPSHQEDPHIWLSPENGRLMAQNICTGLTRRYPAYAEIFSHNLEAIMQEFDALEEYAATSLSNLSCRKLITFHDGFSYMIDAWDLELLHAVEEESGSEASAKELASLCKLVTDNALPAIFTEKSGSVSAAEIINAETGIPSYPLDMAMSGESYFEAMYHNIDVLKEALG